MQSTFAYCLFSICRSFVVQHIVCSAFYWQCYSIFFLLNWKLLHHAHDVTNVSLSPQKYYFIYTHATVCLENWLMIVIDAPFLVIRFLMIVLKDQLVSVNWISMRVQQISAYTDSCSLLLFWSSDNDQESVLLHILKVPNCWLITAWMSETPLSSSM